MICEVASVSCLCEASASFHMPWFLANLLSFFFQKQQTQATLCRGPAPSPYLAVALFSADHLSPLSSAFLSAQFSHVASARFRPLPPASARFRAQAFFTFSTKIKASTRSFARLPQASVNQSFCKDHTDAGISEQIHCLFGPKQADFWRGPHVQMEHSLPTIIHVQKRT